MVLNGAPRRRVQPAAQGRTVDPRLPVVGRPDGLLICGCGHLAVSLEEVDIRSPVDAAVVVVVTRRIEDVGGEVVCVAPKDAHAPKILRQTGASKVFPFAATVGGVPNSGSAITRLRGLTSQKT